MARILLLGLDPETVDFSDPALPPGMTAEKVRAGIKRSRRSRNSVQETVFNPVEAQWLYLPLFVDYSGTCHAKAADFHGYSAELAEDLVARA